MALNVSRTTAKISTNATTRRNAFDLSVIMPLCLLLLENTKPGAEPQSGQEGRLNLSGAT
jgi:hypothetical protein